MHHNENSAALLSLENARVTVKLKCFVPSHMQLPYDLGVKLEFFTRRKSKRVKERTHAKRQKTASYICGFEYYKPQ